MLDEAVNALVTVGFLSFVVSMVTERLKARIPRLDGDWVTLVAIVLGFLACWWWDLQVAAELGYQGLPTQLDYLAGGMAVAGVSGFLAARKNSYRAEDPTSSIYMER